MLRSAFLLVVVLVALSSSSSVLRRKLSRRQADASPCQAIDGFDCKCSYFRVTCTTDRSLPATITISEGEKQKYQSVELVVSAQDNVNVNDHTFEPVKELYKPDADNVEFRLKFEKFIGLHLNSAGLLNRVFPDSLPSNARKHLALEIYNPEVPPQDNVNLFQGLNADSLELYALYPFHGSFQQLFDRANIKFLRLSGGDIRSDVGQPFSGNIHRLELAKQAESLSVQNFPVYPAHEMTINAFYISKFNDEHPPNYDNLGELRVHSKERIPAGAFRQYPNIHTLSVQSEQGIDPNAFQGLDRLEKLIIKETPTTADNLKNLPNVKELETNVDQLDENLQCQLIEKLASGQAAVQAIPNGRHCTCVSAYLDSAAGRTPCDAQDCDQSSCAAIKNNYNANTRQFNAPPAIRRADGSDALRQREPRIYTAPFQVAQPDQEKLNRGTPVQAEPQPEEQDEDRRPNPDGAGGWQPDQPHRPQDQQTGHEGHEGHDGSEHPAGPGGDDNQQQPGDGHTTAPTEAQTDADGNVVSGKDTAAPGKRKMSWLPIIIIIAAIVALLLIGLIFLLLRKRRNTNGPNYAKAGSAEGRPESAVRT